MKLDELNKRVSAARRETESRGETFYPGPSRIHLAAFPPKERWDDWVELDSKAWPERRERRYMLVPTTCFNCESACGLLAYVDRESLQVQKFEGNPEHPGSRGRNCAKGPATLNQVTDPDRILYPLKRAGKRGEGKWVRVSWDEALNEISSRIRKAVAEDRHNEIMYHVGRPGEDGFTERILAAWGVDGHNSHTNVCSSSARAGYQYWLGLDRPSPDHANAKVIFLISSHLETGHYFNPHAQRVIEAKASGAKLIVFDTRLSNTATHADYWVSPYPGSEAAINLSIANYLIRNNLYNREFVRRWWNWEEYLGSEHPEIETSFENFEDVLKKLYESYTFEFAAEESGVDARVLEEIAQVVSTAGTRFSSHNWRSAAAGNSGGWMVARTLFMLNALLGAVATPGGVFPNAWNKFVPKPIYTPPHPPRWNELTWPGEYPLAMNELSFLLPHFLKEGRGRLDVYFTRVYNPVWTNPDGFSWVEALRDESLIGCYVALTPTWNETAYFADYILPMGHGSERHDLHSYETHDAQWIGFRQPVLRAARERMGVKVSDTRLVNPGEVWEENEFWLELTWRIDPLGDLGIRQFVESKKHAGERLTVDEYYEYIFENSVPGLPERAGSEGLAPLEFMRRYGAFEIRKKVGALYEEVVPSDELEDVRVDSLGRVYTKSQKPASTNIVPVASPDPDSEGRRLVGVTVDGEMLRGFPTPSGRLEFYSSTLARWGWHESSIPVYVKSHVHPENLSEDQTVLISTFRLPVQIHTRSANSKWLDEIAHTNPLWIHTHHAAKLGVSTGDLVRVETEIGYFVVRAWVTEGIRPGVVACSHHMGRWKLSD
ncbi:MAG TPA: molybdopterin-dependent oxidoreductase, partial [Pyrinomonadaceae bacterium]|nr:molybdopterin-dependent oxidoreductase [Pyrinomonadaceae bacterium]